MWFVDFSVFALFFVVFCWTYSLTTFLYSSLPSLEKNVFRAKRKNNKI